MPSVSLYAPTDASHALWAIFYALVVGGIALAGYRIKTWPAVKAQLIAAKLADDTIDGNHWVRLHGEIIRLAERVKLLEDEVAECRTREDAAETRARDAERRAADAEARAARFEAIAMGAGQTRQEAALLTAASRIVDDAKKDGK